MKIAAKYLPILGNNIYSEILFYEAGVVYEKKVNYFLKP